MTLLTFSCGGDDLRDRRVVTGGAACVAPDDRTIRGQNDHTAEGVRILPGQAKQVAPEEQARILQPQRRGEPDLADAAVSEPERTVHAPVRVADDRAGETERVAQRARFVRMPRHDGNERSRIELLQCTLHLDQVLVARQSAQMARNDDDRRACAGGEKADGRTVAVDELEIEEGRHRAV